ncbi:MAG: RNA 2',3'-cyclic phosphodiesterase [Anaerolineales bacterium]|nr:RNA 2',3'-cyclic phosphodiesterase [Anaerolineales bacterium]
MSLLRAFIAVEIPPEIHQAIESETAPLRVALDASLVRWVPTDNIHLTLKFLGDVSPANVEMLSQMLSMEVSQHSTFVLKFGGLGAFPNPKRPRVIWIGIQAPAGLEALQHGIEAAAATLGYPSEERPFSPHLTIGRIKQNAGSAGVQKIRNALEQTKVGALGTTQVSAVHLLKSDLKPSGAVYTRLFSAPLKT